jgi:uncharacterized protein (DUF1778 family)
MKKTTKGSVDLRKKTADQKKGQMLRVRVTADQRRILITAAQKAGLDVSSWLRAVAIERARELGVE